MNINQVTLTGRATKDVELRKTSSGTEVATISLAVNGMKEEVSYFDIVTFGKTAEVASKYVNRGKQIAVSGRLQQRKWEDKDGNNRYAVEVVAHQIELLGKGEGVDAQTTPQKDTAPSDVDDTPIDLSQILF